VSESEVSKILALAWRAGIDMLDTARLYGESEAVLGRTMGSSPWRVVSKTARFRDLDGGAVRDQLGADLVRSLTKLSLPALYGLLVHDAEDLLVAQGGHLWDALAERREEGIVGKVGASVYTGRQIEMLLDRFDLDLIQIPINAIDQRLVRTGLLPELKRRGIEIHARSAFLQGLLLAPPEAIDARLGILRTKIGALQAAWREADLTPLEGALAAVLRQPEIDCIIVGVASGEELRQILTAKDKASRVGAEFAIEQWALDDECYVNPALWARLLGG
jgi:aryl-alcohol dehydrogenase-like predicted oxidoreductase